MGGRSSPCRRARDCRPGSIAPSQAPTASVRPADPAASPADDLPLGGDARMAVTVPEILVDADACPVKDEVYRVAGRYELNVRIVANSFMMVPQSPLIEGVIVGRGFDAADDWIAEHASPSAIVVTSAILLAERCVKSGAPGLAPDRKGGAKGKGGS